MEELRSMFIESCLEVVEQLELPLLILCLQIHMSAQDGDIPLPATFSPWDEDRCAPVWLTNPLADVITVRL